MNSMQLVAIIEVCLRTGKTALEIAERLCLRNDGTPLPTLEEFQRDTQKLREMKDLAKGKDDA